MPPIVRHVDDHDAEGLALLERLVNINSGTMNFAGVREVGAVLKPELDALGFTTRWEDGAPYQRAGHLIAERNGTGPKLPLIGHLDTVFEPQSPFQRFRVGLAGSDDHTAKETADLASMPMQVKRAAVLMWRLSAGSNPRP